MKLAAAQAIAAVIPADELHPDYIIPSVFNRRVAESVAEAVARAAVASGVARRKHGAAREPATPLEAMRADVPVVLDLGEPAAGRDRGARLDGCAQPDERDLAAFRADGRVAPDLDRVVEHRAHDGRARADDGARQQHRLAHDGAGLDHRAAADDRPLQLARDAGGRRDQAVLDRGAALARAPTRAAAAAWVRIGHAGSSSSIGGGSRSRSWWLSQYASTVPTSRQ